MSLFLRSVVLLSLSGFGINNDGFIKWIEEYSLLFSVAQKKKKKMKKRKKERRDFHSPCCEH